MIRWWVGGSVRIRSGLGVAPRICTCTSGMPRSTFWTQLGSIWIDANGARNWDEWESQRLLADAVADYAGKRRFTVCGESFMNAGPFGGPYDFKHHPFFKHDYFWVPGVGRMNAATFGNYFAGYVNETALSGAAVPNAGLYLTLAGGSITHPGGALDDPNSVE